MSRPRIAAVALVLVGLVVAYRLGVFEAFGSPEQLRRSMVDLGGWGFATFVAAYTVLQPFGVPGTVFIMAAPLVWPWPVAFGLSMTGTMLASLVGFGFARFVGRDWVAGKVPPRIKKYEDALRRRGFATVFTLRLVFWMPQWLHVFFGVSGVPFWTHFWGSLAGYTLPLFLVSYFGQELFDGLRALPAEAWVGMGAATVAVAIVAWLLARRGRARRGVA